MKIESLTLTHLRMPLVSAFETSFGRITHRECILVAARAEGLTGYGECVADRDPGYSYETTGTAWHIIKDFIAPLVVGQEIADAGDFQRRVDGIRGHHFAKAGVEMAVWDLLGRREGKSLRELLGGERTRVDVGVSIGLQATPEKLVRQAAEYVAQGYRRVKIKIKPGRDTADALAVRAAFPNLLLQVDANSAYTLKTSAALKPLDDLDLLLIEQPLYEDDIWDHRKLQAGFKTAICLDESIVTPRHARYAIEIEACRIINIKPGRLGGLSQAVAVHDLCRSRGMPVWCGGMLETGVGRASNLALASLPGFTLPGDISASERYYLRDITRERFTLNADSTIDVPAAPGLGVSVDQSALRAFTLAEIVIAPR
ncbi:MAG: o-succinylbenzoate synthase [Anaerolineae bacterium CFX3]|nr:o-succinylbenzoate synthase [Anaerolineae bacterium CFX3]MCQ3946129.1 o-succinylbenzoate synthase [Anaerolineae bacterium]RIK27548.1 MAG: o-succinylbenzoate synthase [Anaerolineae bacterium]